MIFIQSDILLYLPTYFDPFIDNFFSLVGIRLKDCRRQVYQKFPCHYDFSML